MPDRALILIDLQNDFCPGGALEVAHGDETIAIANRLQRHFELVVATQDWHPADHGSFAANHPGKQPYEVIELHGLPQVLWPPHCVQGTPGAEFHPALERASIAKVFLKGTDPTVDSYSGFHDNGHRKSTGMGEWLREQGVKQVYVLGLATDYCVKFSALDARADGFECVLVADACRAVERTPGDGDLAIDVMRGAGVVICTSGDLGI